MPMPAAQTVRIRLTRGWPPPAGEAARAFHRGAHGSRAVCSRWGWMASASAADAAGVSAAPSAAVAARKDQWSIGTPVWPKAADAAYAQAMGGALHKAIQAGLALAMNTAKKSAASRPPPAIDTVRAKLVSAAGSGLPAARKTRAKRAGPAAPAKEPAANIPVESRRGPAEADGRLTASKMGWGCDGHQRSQAPPPAWRHMAWPASRKTMTAATRRA